MFSRAWVLDRVEHHLRWDFAAAVGSDGLVGRLAAAEVDRDVADELRRAVVLTQLEDVEAAVFGEVAAPRRARPLEREDRLLQIAHEYERSDRPLRQRPHRPLPGSRRAAR